MRIAVRSLLGIGSIPADRSSAKKRLSAMGVPVAVAPDDGRKPEFVSLSDLPPKIRLAYVQRECAQADLPAGTYDDLAHEIFADAPPKMRAEAERKAAVARLLLTAGKLLSWPEKVALVASRLGAKGLQKPL